MLISYTSQLVMSVCVSVSLCRESVPSFSQAAKGSSPFSAFSRSVCFNWPIREATVYV